MTETSSIAKTSIEEGQVIAGQPLTVNALSRMLGGPTIPKRWKDLRTAITGVKYGEELGLAPLESLYRLYPVNGALACDSKGLNALIHRAGHYLTYTEMTEERCAVTAHRRLESGEYVEVGEFEFTMEDAERAGLDAQDTYQLYPKDMLLARAVSRAAKAAFPDVTTGLLLPEEYGIPSEIDDTEAATAALETILEAEDVGGGEDYA